jgi:hypothetical protein
MHQIEVSGLLHAMAALLLGTESLVPIECGDGWATEIVWMIWRSECLALSANCAVFPELSNL